MRSSLLRRYLLFLVVITAAVLGAEQLFQLYFLNTTGRAEAERALSLHPELAQHLGPHQFGFAWRGSDEWWMVGPANSRVYVPVEGQGASGVIYLREYGQAGAWELRKLSFRPTGSSLWSSY